MDPTTLDGRHDLEAEIISRCVRALQLRGRSRTWLRSLDKCDVARVLRYLADRFGVTA